MGFGDPVPARVRGIAHRAAVPATGSAPGPVAAPLAAAPVAPRPEGEHEQADEEEEEQEAAERVEAREVDDLGGVRPGTGHQPGLVAEAAGAEGDEAREDEDEERAHE